MTSADLQCNGFPVRAGTLQLRRRAQWVATLALEASIAPAEGSRAELTSGGCRFVGTLQRAGVDRGGVVQVRIVGGAGGLNNILPPRSYIGRPAGSGVRSALTARTVLEGIASDAGETLSTTIESALLDTELPAWIRPRMRTTLALDALGEALGAAWRTLPDGTIWMGAETWPEVTLSGAVQLTDLPQLRQRNFAFERFEDSLQPGVTYLGQKVDIVSWEVGSRPVAQLAAPLDDGLTLDDDLLDRDVAIKARAAVVEVYALGAHRARVVVQHDDDETVDLEPEGDPQMRQWAGLVRVPVRYTVPGLSMKLPAAPDALWCLFGFEAADPRRPVVLGFESRASQQGEVTLGVPASGMLHLGTTQDEQFVALAQKVMDALEALRTAHNTHKHVETGGTTNAADVQVGTLASVAAQRVKAG